MNEIPRLNDPTDPQPLFASLVSGASARWPSLPDKPEETPEAGIRALWFTAAGQSRSLHQASAGELPPLSQAGLDALNGLINQRLAGMPLAHLTGWQQFMGLEFKTGPQALIPRRETEIVGNAALRCLNELVQRQGHARVIDLCTGSGNLAIALAVLEPACQVFAADLSEDAVALARENARFHKLEGRIEFRAGDLFSPFPLEEFGSAVDLIVCNPPYLSTAKVGNLPKEISAFEPRLAFEGGGFGLAIISRLVAEAPRYLKPDSRLCFEVGLGQGAYLASHLQRLGPYRNVETAKDGGGEIRAIVASTPTL